jgi:hypothetical protein
MTIRSAPIPPVRLLAAAAAMSLASCAVQDSRLAQRGEQRFIGMRESDLESCLGAPDQHASFGATDVLTYYATSTSTTSFTVPVVGGVGLGNGGYCHATFRLESGVVTRVLYSGEKNATFAPDAYCAPIMRTCLGYLDKNPAAGPVVSPSAAPPAMSTPAAPPPR